MTRAIWAHQVIERLRARTQRLTDGRGRIAVSPRPVSPGQLPSVRLEQVPAPPTSPPIPTQARAPSSACPVDLGLPRFSAAASGEGAPVYRASPPSKEQSRTPAGQYGARASRVSHGETENAAAAYHGLPRQEMSAPVLSDFARSRAALLTMISQNRRAERGKKTDDRVPCAGSSDLAQSAATATSQSHPP